MQFGTPLLKFSPHRTEDESVLTRLSRELQLNGRTGLVFEPPDSPGVAAGFPFFAQFLKVSFFSQARHPEYDEHFTAFFWTSSG